MNVVFDTCFLTAIFKSLSLLNSALASFPYMVFYGKWHSELPNNILGENALLG